VEGAVAQSHIGCEECEQLYQGRPPCEDCELKDLELPIGAERAWDLWQQLHFFSRPRGFGFFPIPLSEVKALCEVLQESRAVFEWILFIEAQAYPKLAALMSGKEPQRAEHG